MRNRPQPRAQPFVRSHAPVGARSKGLDSTIYPADKPSSCGKAALPKGKQACQLERRLAAGRNPMPSGDAKSNRGYFGLLQESTAGKLVREFVGKAVLIA